MSIERATFTADAARAFTAKSLANAAYIRGQLACDCEPYADVFTYRRWQAQGQQVRRGEKGIKIPVVKTVEGADDDDAPRKRDRRILGSAAVFCRCQVDPAGTKRRATRKDAPPNAAPVKERDAGEGAGESPPARATLGRGLPIVKAEFVTLALCSDTLHIHTGDAADYVTSQAVAANTRGEGSIQLTGEQYSRIRAALATYDDDVTPEFALDGDKLHVDAGRFAATLPGGTGTVETYATPVPLCQVDTAILARALTYAHAGADADNDQRYGMVVIDFSAGNLTVYGRRTTGYHVSTIPVNPYAASTTGTAWAIPRALAKRLATDVRRAGGNVSLAQSPDNDALIVSADDATYRARNYPEHAIPPLDWMPDVNRLWNVDASVAVTPALVAALTRKAAKDDQTTLAITCGDNTGSRDGQATIRTGDTTTTQPVKGRGEATGTYPALQVKAALNGIPKNTPALLEMLTLDDNPPRLAFQAKSADVNIEALITPFPVKE